MLATLLHGTNHGLEDDANDSQKTAEDSTETQDPDRDDKAEEYENAKVNRGNARAGNTSVSTLMLEVSYAMCSPCSNAGTYSRRQNLQGGDECTNKDVNAGAQNAIEDREFSDDGDNDLRRRAERRDRSAEEENPLPQ